MVAVRLRRAARGERTGSCRGTRSARFPTRRPGLLGGTEAPETAPRSAADRGRPAGLGLGIWGRDSARRAFGWAGGCWAGRAARLCVSADPGGPRRAAREVPGASAEPLGEGMRSHGGRGSFSWGAGLQARQAAPAGALGRSVGVTLLCQVELGRKALVSR